MLRPIQKHEKPLFILHISVMWFILATKHPTWFEQGCSSKKSLPPIHIKQKLSKKETKGNKSHDATFFPWEKNQKETSKRVMGL